MGMRKGREGRRTAGVEVGGVGEPGACLKAEGAGVKGRGRWKKRSMSVRERGGGGARRRERGGRRREGKRKSRAEDEQ
jgi:hypothetical protein